MNTSSLTYDLAGRIDSGNAGEVKAALLQSIDEAGAPSVVFDAKNLVYISSAGLRVILDVQEMRKITMSFINVNSDIAEIFDMTGLSRIFDVQKVMRSCIIDGSTMLGKGANGEVYALDDDTIIKVFYPGIPLEVIKREQRLSQAALLAGIPSVIPYDTVRVGDDRYGNVYEKLGTRTLSQTISEDPSHFDHWMELYADLFRKIHSTSVDLLGVSHTKEIYHSYFDGCADWYTEDDLNALKKLVDSIPESNMLIHGDYHPNNIMVNDERLILIDLGDMSIGHAAFDFLSTAATQANLVDLDPAYAEIHTRMKVEYIKKGWQALLRLNFPDRSEEERAVIDRQIRLLSKLKVACAPVIAKGIPEELIRNSVNDAKQNLIPRIDELTNAFNW